MKTDEIQAAAGSLSAHVRRLMGAAGATGRWSASVLRLWFGATGRWWASVLRLWRPAAVGSSTLDPTHAAAVGPLAGWLRWDFGTLRVCVGGCAAGGGGVEERAALEDFAAAVRFADVRGYLSIKGANPHKSPHV